MLTRTLAITTLTASLMAVGASPSLAGAKSSPRLQSNAAMQALSLGAGKLAWSRSGWTFQSGDLSGATGKHLYATSPTGTVDSLNPLTGKVKYSLNQAV